MENKFISKLFQENCDITINIYRHILPKSLLQDKFCTIEIRPISTDTNLGWYISNEYKVITTCGWFINLIKIQLFIILSYEDLKATHRRPCADDLCYFHLREFHQPIKIHVLHTSTFQSFPLSESDKLRYDW